ncbi:MAG TPA: hypothetical protein VHV31_07705 [Nitrolancea sp.]|nr:hypothetical protein [Nitrolancea sp.]
MKSFVLVLVGLVLLAACGGGSSSTATTTSAAVASTATTAPAATSETNATAQVTTTAAGSAATVQATATTESTTAATSSTTPAATTVASAVSSPPATAATTPNTPAGLATEDQLSAALIKLSDLPAGWVTSPSDESSNVEATGFCQPDASSGITQSRASADYETEDESSYATETLTNFAPGDAAAWMKWLKPGVSCGQASEDQDSGTPTTYQVAPLSIPTVGDEMYAYQLTANDQALGVIKLDIVYTRFGNCVAAVGNVGFGDVDSNLTQSLVQKAMDNAKSVCGS